MVRLLILILTILISACSSQQKTSSIEITEHSPIESQDEEHFCSPDWFRYVESQLNSADAQGHGPDLGSPEWQSVIEFKLDLPAHADIPLKSTPEWCQFIQAQLDEQRHLPTFSCQDKTLNSIEKDICKVQALTRLDRKMNTVFDAALERVTLEISRELKAEQRGWIKGRDACWKSDHVHRCVSQLYKSRIAELQVKYELIDALGPIFYVCDGRPLDEIIVKFFSTDPPSILAERAGEIVFMLQQKTASGSKYQGRNETFWEHQGQAHVIWGANTTEMICEKMH